MDTVAALTRDGFAVVQRVLDEPLVMRLTAAFEDALASRAPATRHAMRDIVQAVPATRELLRDARIAKLAQLAIGPSACVVRGLFFDKVPGRNWPVAWHQDQTIAVAERVDTPGFGPWSVKAGIPHTRAPRETLDGMVAIRLHLDNCPLENGALRCVPGSHRLGIMDDTAIREARRTHGEAACAAHRGDALLMKPLTLHASSPATLPRHRRVIHLECAAKDLPGELRWYERLPFTAR